ncbi:MAG TPA: trypsin-like peptidase domain-containing protein [Verrucomicrobiae bacterium]|nr:trypsin-like peptidase domain-containing protein [Verrucomicrobiae bacterium]
MKPLKLFSILVATVAFIACDFQICRADEGLDLARRLNETFAEIAEKVSPCVVVITVTEKPPSFSETVFDTPDSTNEFWRRFHRQLDENSQGEGSGIIIRKNGYILTNRHVVEDADKIEVRLRDGRVFRASVRGVDRESDIAVLKIDASDLPVATLGDSSKIRVGEFALAIGAPFDLEYTVTCGHISAKNRSNVVPGYLGGRGMDQDFIQTDANMNPGNSGGPLVNIDGEVIGVNTLIRGVRTGIGFAIPSNLAKEVAEKLIAEGKFIRPWLGIGIRALQDEPDFREWLNGPRNGVVVRSIIADGPAAKTDLRPADVITAVDGKSVATAQELRDAIRGKRTDQTVSLDVFRDGKNVKVEIQLEAFSDGETSSAARKNSIPDFAPVSVGFSVKANTPELAEQFGTRQTSGIIVVSVDQGGIAARAGIKPGDIVTAINQKSIATPKEFSNAMKNADLKKGVVVNLISDDTARFEILKARER